MNRICRFATGILASLALLCVAPLWASAAPDPLGTAANFLVLGGAGVTCTGSTVNGDVGSLLTVTQTGCHISGAIRQGQNGDPTVGPAFNDFVTAYTAFNKLACPPDNKLSSTADIGTRTLGPGVYCFPSTAALKTGTLTLNGSASDVWVFQVGTAITTAGPGQGLMTGGASACNVYWVLGTAATIGTDTKFQGNILAGSAVTFTGANSSLAGRALAQQAVTMTGTTISGCGTSAGGGGGGGGNEDKDHKGDHRDGDHDRDGDHHGGDHEGGDHNGGDHERGDHNGGDHNGGDHKGGR